jgi:hypothetical protein
MTFPAPQYWQAVADVREKEVSVQLENTSRVNTLEAAFQLSARQAPDTKNVACSAMVHPRYTVLEVSQACGKCWDAQYDFNLSIIPAGQ